MKRLKKIVIVVVLLLAVPLIIALFVRTEFVVQREVVINRSNEAVFDFVSHVKNQVNYTQWATIDPETKFNDRGEDGTVGFVMGWESAHQDVGKGEQEIKQIVDGERVDLEIRFREPFESVNSAYTSTAALGDDQTKVTSVYLGKLPYPTNLLCPFVAGKIGAFMESNLTAMKDLLEGE